MIHLSKYIYLPRNLTTRYVSIHFWFYMFICIHICTCICLLYTYRPINTCTFIYLSKCTQKHVACKSYVYTYVYACRTPDHMGGLGGKGWGGYDSGEEGKTEDGNELDQSAWNSLQYDNLEVNKSSFMDPSLSDGFSCSGNDISGFVRWIVLLTILIERIPKPRGSSLFVGCEVKIAENKNPL